MRKSSRRAQVLCMLYLFIFLYTLVLALVTSTQVQVVILFSATVCIGLIGMAFAFSSRGISHNGDDARYRTLIQTTSQGYWFVSPRFETLDVNEALCKMLGYEQKEIMGKSIFEFADNENKQIFADATLKITEQDHRSYEIVLRKKSGEEVHCYFNATTLRDKSGKIEGSFAFVTDITERKRAEEALKSSQRQLADIIEFLPDATLVIDKEGKVIAWNRETEKMTGYKAGDMLGRGDNEYAIPFYGERRPIIVDLVLMPQEAVEREYRSIARDGDILRGDTTLTVVRGENRHLSAWARPIYDASGQIVGAIECIRDITELEQYRQHLEEMIERRTIELKQAKEAAEAAASAKSEFLANMSHEIRTPMNAIIGFSGLALKTDLTAKQYDYIRKIENSAKSLLGIINDILDFSKIEAGRMELESTDFRLDDVINNVVNTVSVAAAMKGIELISTIAEDVPRALIGDPLRLGQVLTNLANNAVKFTEAGHILIKAEILAKNSKQCKIKFDVRDTGIGMTQEQIGKLFTAFSQVDSSVTRKYGGTGLGLSISKRLVEMMNGEISVDSTLNDGSTFSFTAEFARQSEEKEYRLMTPADFSGIKVLIVDDNESAREVLTEQIRAFGLDANSVESGEKAIAELNRVALGKPYELVLMDWKMPGMDGIQAAQVIMKDKKLGHTPLIIMVSAFGREEVIKRAEKAGINTFLMKPVNQSLLFDTIMQSFNRDAACTANLQFMPTRTVELKPKIKGAKVLLVEDNILNQQVAMEMLTEEGLNVEIANNGQEAVDAVARADFDIVFMDIQMPVMGGYEAARLIRTDARNSGLPIIAMTAHAMQGAREECIGAGMNDYISKPIDPDQLFGVVNRWLKGDMGAETGKAGSRLREQSKGSSPRNLAGIDVEAGLKRLNNNTALYEKLLLDFSHKFASCPAEIRKMLHAGDFEAAGRLTHTLKGVAGNLSITGVCDFARLLEEAVLAGTEGAIEHSLTGLDKELPLVIQSISLYTKDAEEPEKEPPKDSAAISQMMFELAKLLEEDNLDAVQCLESLKKHLNKSQLGTEIQAFDQHVHNYDFDSAKRSLTKIALKMNIDIGGILHE